MPYVLVRHKVEDYGKWRPIFDEDASNRLTHGSKGGAIYRNHDDPNELLIVMEYENLERAREFTDSPDLKASMEKAGVMDHPDIYFLDEIDKFSA